jgi:uncharacterized membrane protein (UPF0127 family)
MDVATIDGPRGLRLRCLVPRTRRERTRGLRGQARLDPDEAMWLERATSVHTFGMTFAISVVRLDRSGRVIDARVVPPRRLVLPSPRIGSVLECHVDTDVRVGDRLHVRIERSAEPAEDAAGRSVNGAR